MRENTQNVVPLFQSGFPRHDVDMIETLLLVAVGDEISIDCVERTSMSLGEMRQEFLAAPTMELKGFAMPLYRWRFELNTRHIDLYVIDAGSYRAFYYKPRIDGFRWLASAQL